MIQMTHLQIKEEMRPQFVICLSDTDFPRGDAVATSELITGHDCLVAHFYWLSIYPSNITMNADHFPDCTV
jgi:hypothetical protein